MLIRKLKSSGLLRNSKGKGSRDDTVEKGSRMEENDSDEQRKGQRGYQMEFIQETRLEEVTGSDTRAKNNTISSGDEHGRGQQRNPHEIGDGEGESVETDETQQKRMSKTHHPKKSAFVRVKHYDPIPDVNLNKRIVELAMQGHRKFSANQYYLALRDFDGTLMLVSQQSEHPSVYRELLADIIMLKASIYLSSEKFVEAMDEYCVAVELYRLRHNAVVKKMIEDGGNDFFSTFALREGDRLNQKMGIAFVNVANLQFKMKNLDIAAEIYESCYYLFRCIWHMGLTRSEGTAAGNDWIICGMLPPLLEKIVTIHKLRRDEEAALRAKAEAERLDATKSHQSVNETSFGDDFGLVQTNPYSIEIEENYDVDPIIERLLHLVGQERVGGGRSRILLNASLNPKNIFEDMLDQENENFDNAEKTKDLRPSTTSRSGKTVHFSSCTMTSTMSSYSADETEYSSVASLYAEASKLEGSSLDFLDDEDDFEDDFEDEYHDSDDDGRDDKCGADPLPLDVLFKPYVCGRYLLSTLEILLAHYNRGEHKFNTFGGYLSKLEVLLANQIHGGKKINWWGFNSSEAKRDEARDSLETVSSY